MTLSKFNASSGRVVGKPHFSNFWSDDFFRPLFRDLNVPSGTSVAANISESESAFCVELVAPGLKKEDFNISIEKDILKVKAEKGLQESVARYHRKEFALQSFERSFKLPDSVDQSAITAKYEQGILVLELPKVSEEKRQTAVEIPIV